MKSWLLAAADDLTRRDAADLWKVGMIAAGVVAIGIALILLIIFFSFLRLWVQCLLTGAQISILDLVGM